MKRVLIVGLTMMVTVVAIAQQDAMFTHYSFNTLAVNSGYAGSRDALTVTGLHRSQWITFPGAPTTQTLTIHAPVANEKVGLGFSVLNDKIGPTKRTSFYGDFAYKIPVGKGKLAFGLKAGINMLSNDLNSLSTDQNNDPNLTQKIKNKISPNFGFGMYYSTNKYYLGLSTPRLLEDDSNAGTTTGSYKRHYFFIAGTIFPLSSSVKLKPTTFVKLTPGAPVELDLTGLFYFQDKVWVGPMLRFGDAFGVLAGLNLSDQLSLGYSFDWSFVNKTSKYNNGSHELMLRYDFLFNDKHKIRSPRYF